MPSFIRRFLIASFLFLIASCCVAQQLTVLSASCPAGTKDSQAMYETGMQILSGKGGYKKDFSLAEDYLELAVSNGNTIAAMTLGQLYQYNLGNRYTKARREKYMIAMYIYAAEVGCPDADAALAECYEQGLGIKKDQKKAFELAKKAAEAGSPKGMALYGGFLINDKNKTAEGRKWLRRSIELGNGDAGMPLADTYAREKNVEGIIKSLYAGAAKGSKQCLEVLSKIYTNGHYGQSKDPAQAACYKTLDQAIDNAALPHPIANFEKRCQMKKFFLPFKNK